MEHREEQKNPAEAKQEREKAINEFWKKIANHYMHRPCSECPATDGDDCGYYDGTCGRSIRKKYESIAGNTKEMILPIPCTVGFDDWTVKQWFQKINEELDELKTAVLACNCGLEFKMQLFLEEKEHISEEAADTITAITSMLEAMGINEDMRQEAQRKVNEKNRERGRIA